MIPKPAMNSYRRFMKDLRRPAAAKMAKERPGQTLQATALVHVVE